MRLVDLLGTPTLTLALVLGSLLATLSPSAPARACSESMPVRHRVWIASDGSAWALADPGGRLVHLTTDGRVETVQRAGRHPNEISDLDAGGTRLVTLHVDFSDESLGAACEATWVRVDAAPTGSGRARRGRRLDLAGGHRLEMSPDGTRAALSGTGRGGEGIVQIVALDSGRSLRALEASDALWVDAATLVALGDDGALSLSAEPGGAPRELLAAAAEPTVRRLLPGARSAQRVLVAEGPAEGAWRLRRLDIAATGVTTTDSRWTHAGLPLGVSPAGGTVIVRENAVIDERRRTGALLLLDAGSGAVRLRIEGQHGYTAAALSADERWLVVSSYGAPPAGDGDDAYDPDAFLPTAIELIDLGEARVVSAWGRAERSRVVRPAPPPSARRPSGARR